MDSYTITIAPNDESGNFTTLIVDTSGDQVCITDVHLHSAGGLTGGQMPTVDFRLLLQAVGSPASSPASLEAAPDEAPTALEAVTPAPEVAEAAGAPEAAATVRTRRAARPRAAKRSAKAAAAAAPESAPEPVNRPRARRAAAATPRKAAATPRNKAAKKAAAPAETGGRAYRRMPADFAGVYRQAGTPAAIADHYAVPRHTAQGWIRRQKAIDAAADN